MLALDQHIILMRHGEGVHNVEEFHNSTPAHPNYRVSDLTPKGQGQVRCTAAYLKENQYNPNTISQVIVSPLPRTQQTAAILMEEGVISPESIMLSDLAIELQVGELEGVTYSSHGGHSWNPELFPRYGGEDSAALRLRMQALLDLIKRTKSPGHTLVISHGSPVSMLSEILSGHPVVIATAASRIFPKDFN